MNSTKMTDFKLPNLRDSHCPSCNHNGDSHNLSVGWMGGIMYFQVRCSWMNCPCHNIWNAKK